MAVECEALGGLRIREGVGGIEDRVEVGVMVYMVTGMERLQAMLCLSPTA